MQVIRGCYIMDDSDFESRMDRFIRDCFLAVTEVFNEIRTVCLDHAGT